MCSRLGFSRVTCDALRGRCVQVAPGRASIRDPRGRAAGQSVFRASGPRQLIVANLISWRCTVYVHETFSLCTTRPRRNATHRRVPGDNVHRRSYPRWNPIAPYPAGVPAIGVRRFPVGSFAANVTRRRCFVARFLARGIFLSVGPSSDRRREHKSRPSLL